MRFTVETVSTVNRIVRAIIPREGYVMTERNDSAVSPATGSESPETIPRRPDKRKLTTALVIAIGAFLIASICALVSDNPKPIPPELKGRWTLSADFKPKGLPSANMKWSFLVGKDQITAVHTVTTGPAGQFTSDLGDPSGTSVKMDGDQIVVNLGQHPKEGDLGGFVLTRQGADIKGKLANKDGQVDAKSWDVTGSISPELSNDTGVPSPTPAARAPSPVEQKKEYFLKVASKMGPGDEAMAQQAIKMIDGGTGWAAADDLMREAGSETRAAYREWRKAAFAN